jgi:hypothetical protein
MSVFVRGLHFSYATMAGTLFQNNPPSYIFGDLRPLTFKVVIERYVVIPVTLLFL